MPVFNETKNSNRTNREFKVSCGKCECAHVTSSLLPYMHLFQDVLEFMWLCPGQSCSHITEVDGVIHHSLARLHHLEDRLSDTQEHTQKSYRTLRLHTLNLLMRGFSFRFFLQLCLTNTMVISRWNQMLHDQISLYCELSVEINEMLPESQTDFIQGKYGKF